MPGHAAAAVRVQVVSLGVAGTGTYTYNAGPALLFAAPPGGEVGVAYSDQLTVTGGTSPFTWSVSAGSSAAGDDPRCVQRAAVRDAGHRGRVLLHGESHRPCRAERYRAGDSECHRRAVAGVPRAAGGLDEHRLRRHADRVRRDEPVCLVGEQRCAARRTQPQRGREPDRHPDRGRGGQLHGPGDRRQRAERHPGHQHHDQRGGIGDVPRAAGGGPRYRLLRHPHRHRRHHSLHLVGERRRPAARHHPHLRGRPRGHPDRRRQLSVLGQRDRQERRHRHHPDHPGGQREPGRGAEHRPERRRGDHHPGEHSPLHDQGEQHGPGRADRRRPSPTRCPASSTTPATTATRPPRRAPCRSPAPT